MSYPRSPFVLASLLGSALLVAPSRATADVITVTVKKVAGGVSSVRVVDPNRPQNSVSVFVNTVTPAGITGSTSLGSKTANNRGRANFSSIPPVVGPSSLTILIGSAFTEHFNIEAVSGAYQSLEEENINANVLSSFSALPFGGTNDVFVAGGTPFSQFDLTNNSTQFTYDFTSLKLYTDLNSDFFTTQAFDSAAAIASGTLAQDIVAANGGFLAIPVAGQGVSSQISFSAPFTDFGSYELLIGTARPILGNGQFGDPQNFAIGAAVPVPESTSAVLLAGGTLCLLVYRRSKRGASKGPKIWPATA